MQPQQSPRKSRLLNRLLIVFFVILLTLGGLFLTQSFYKVNKVEVIGKDLKKDQFSTNQFNGQNLILLNELSVEEQILERNPDFKSVDVSKQYPNTLKIKVLLDKSAGKLLVDQGTFYLNESGKILSKERDQKKKDVPSIKYYQKLSYLAYLPGDKITYNDILITLYFINKLKGLGFEVDSVDISGLNMIRLNLKEGVILITTEKDLKIQTYQLEKIVKQFKVEGKSFVSLDLRFDKPIVKLK